MTPEIPEVNGRKFARLKQFDERSRNFPIRALIPAVKKPRGYTWRPQNSLDQGSEGACVGFAWAHELAARPSVMQGVSADLARLIYYDAQALDEWEGADYDGTSVIAGAKAIVERKYMGEYRWAFGLQDLVIAIGYAGPAVLGLNWYEGMFTTDAEGYVHPSGQIAGGHAILCFGVSMVGRYFKLQNSWGVEWGHFGHARITFDDMDRLLHEQGEACIPVKRRYP